MRLTVTIARQLGSGGSYVGQRIATALNLRYVDREVLRRSAEELHCEEWEVAEHEERVSSFWERLLDAFAIGTPDATYAPPAILPLSDLDVFNAETRIMKSMTDEMDCVIIGRAAHTLPQHPGMFNFLLHAPVDFRVQRVREIYRVADEAKARQMIADSDAMREKFVARMADRIWLSAENYHLAIDTSLLPLDEVAEVLVDYIHRRG